MGTLLTNPLSASLPMSPQKAVLCFSLQSVLHLFNSHSTLSNMFCAHSSPIASFKFLIHLASIPLCFTKSNSLFILILFCPCTKPFALSIQYHYTIATITFHPLSNPIPPSLQSCSTLSTILLLPLLIT